MYRDSTNFKGDLINTLYSMSAALHHINDVLHAIAQNYGGACQNHQCRQQGESNQDDMDSKKKAFGLPVSVSRPPRGSF